MSTLREAARALASLILDSEPPAPSWHALQATAVSVRAALDAPPPAPEELRRKLEELWAMGYRYGSEHMMGMPGGPRDRLIDELLAMMQR